MKALGVIRNIDKLGRIVIPKEVRDTKGWDTNTPIEMFATEDGVFFREYGRQQEAAEIIDQLNAANEEATSSIVKSAIEKAKEFIARG